MLVTFGKEKVDLHERVARWFLAKFARPTPAQEMAIPLIAKGHNVLISSPTGTGKTLAAFLWIMSEIAKMLEKEELNEVKAIYVSPLRALNNDIRRNLLEPLSEMGLNMRIAVRTGDTSTYERQKMLKEPPHILITTPETLAIVLVAPKFSKLLKPKWVIVDEIHALFENKRGAHLALSLERLAYRGEFQRIGLSATICPLEEVAKFLCGDRPFKIVNASFAKKRSIKVDVPCNLHLRSDEINERMYKALERIIRKNRTTLIFTNTRSGAERVSWHLRKEFEIEALGTHHSSLSRDVRLEVEEKMKKGLLKAVVSSTSLELGIDIGYIDCVVQIGSPKSITRALQRIGRAGHRLHEISRGIMLCMSINDLLECACIAKCAKEEFLDKSKSPRAPLDVLAQHLLGMAIEKKWKVEEAYKLVKRAYNYKDLTYEDFLATLRYISGQYGLESYKIYGKVWFDPENGEFGRKRYARVIYTLNVGTIPEEVQIKVYLLPERKFVGTIEEEFLERLLPGDIFVLSGRAFEFVKAKGLKAFVRDASGKRPTIPAWFSEMLPLSFDLGLEILRFRKMYFEGRITKEKLKRDYGLSEKACEALTDYMELEKEFREAHGCKDELLVQEYFDLEGFQNFIFDFPFGRRVNEALAKALAYRISKKKRCNVGISVHDQGFMLMVPRERSVKIKPFLKEMVEGELESALRKAIERSEMFKRRFRHCATRALMVLKNYKGHEIKVKRQMRNAEVILRAVKKIEGFPILKETIREIMEDAMDVSNAKRVLEMIRSGELKVKVIRVDVPSPLTHEIYACGLSDVVLMEDRKRLLEHLYSLTLKKIGKKY